MPHKLIVNNCTEEHVYEYEDIEKAYDAAVPWIMKGYVTRVTDIRGVVLTTQASSNGQIQTFHGDQTTIPLGRWRSIVRAISRLFRR